MAWYGESRRHALAAKGIKTGHRFQSRQHMTVRNLCNEKVRNMTDTQKAESASTKKTLDMGEEYFVHGRPFSREVFAQLRKVKGIYYHDYITCEESGCFCGKHGWYLIVDEKTAPILRAAGYTIGTKEESEANKEAQKMAESANP